MRESVIIIINRALMIIILYTWVRDVRRSVGLSLSFVQSYFFFISLFLKELWLLGAFLKSRARVSSLMRH